MCSLQQLEQQVEDIVKVYEARLTERETTSLEPSIVQEDSSALQVTAPAPNHHFNVVVTSHPGYRNAVLIWCVI